MVAWSFFIWVSYENSGSSYSVMQDFCAPALLEVKGSMGNLSWVLGAFCVAYMKLAWMTDLTVPHCDLPLPCGDCSSSLSWRSSWSVYRWLLAKSCDKSSSPSLTARSLFTSAAMQISHHAWSRFSIQMSAITTFSPCAKSPPPSPSLPVPPYPSPTPISMLNGVHRDIWRNPKSLGPDRLGCQQLTRESEPALKAGPDRAAETEPMDQRKGNKSFSTWFTSCLD